MNVIQERDILGRNPRKMKIVTPLVKLDDRKIWKARGAKDTLLACYRSKIRLNEMNMYESAEPKWKEDIKGYTLNFNERVTLPSAKNFQIRIVGDGK